MVNPFDITETTEPFDEPAGQTFNIYADAPSMLHAEPSEETEQPSEAPAEPETEEHSEPVDGLAVNYITAQESADLLGMNLNHLRQLTFQKKLTVAKREGRRSLYSLTAINEYKEKQNAKP